MDYTFINRNKYFPESHFDFPGNLLPQEAQKSQENFNATTIIKYIKISYRNNTTEKTRQKINTILLISKLMLLALILNM